MGIRQQNNLKAVPRRLAPLTNHPQLRPAQSLPELQPTPKIALTVTVTQLAHNQADRRKPQLLPRRLPKANREQNRREGDAAR